MNDHTLSQAAMAAVRQYHMLSPGDRVLVGVSGGADSVALLWLLCQWREQWDLTLSAAHINHGLRGEAADRDQALVEDLCRQWQVPLAVHRADVAALCRQTGQGEEACGRQVRYAFFEEIAQGGKIATAHTAGDNAETVLMNLIRGTGLSGLCGIPPVRGNIIRPLIFCTREMTEGFCRENKLPFCEDETNREDKYRRNSIRHHLIPLCLEQNPAFLESVTRCSGQNRRDLAYLSRQGEELLASAKEGENYRLKPLADSPEVPLYYAVKALLEGACRQPVSAVHIEKTVQLIQKGGGSYCLPGGVTVCLSSGLLTMVATKKEEPLDQAVAVDPEGGRYTFGEKQVTLTPLSADQRKVCNFLTYNLLDRDTIGKHLFLRTRQPGDEITLPGRPAKTLKKLFNEQKIPLWERDDRLILCDETGVLWAEGLGCDRRCLAKEDTARLLAVYITGGQKDEIRE